MTYDFKDSRRKSTTAYAVLVCRFDGVRGAAVGKAHPGRSAAYDHGGAPSRRERHRALSKSWSMVWRGQGIVCSTPTQMTDSSETKLIEALKKVEAYGDVAPAHVHDPTAMIMRQIAERSSLMRGTM